jgi:hypothetical protein
MTLSLQPLVASLSQDFTVGSELHTDSVPSGLAIIFLALHHFSVSRGQVALLSVAVA